MLAMNYVDFSAAPFVAAPGRECRVVYCGGHYKNRDTMPEIHFPKGIPAIGQQIRFFVEHDTRFTKNQFRSDGQGGAFSGGKPFGERTIIRVYPLEKPPESLQSLPNLIYVPRSRGHIHGKNDGNWDVAVEGARKVYQWRNVCAGGKWWEWFTLAVIDPDAEIVLHRTGSYAGGRKIIDERRALQVA